jgi:hypothetical protein
MAPENRRQQPREAVRWEAQWQLVGGAGAPQFGQVNDFTPDGLFIRCSGPLLAQVVEGARVRVVFPSPCRPATKDLIGVVRWRDPHSATFGVKFEAADPELDQYLATCLELWIGS